MSTRVNRIIPPKQKVVAFKNLKINEYFEVRSRIFVKINDSAGSNSFRLPIQLGLGIPEPYSISAMEVITPLHAEVTLSDS